MGILSLKKHLLETTWNKYQANIPELLKRLRVLKKKSDESLAHIQQQVQGRANVTERFVKIKSTDSSKLRANAARYVMQFLQSIEKLLTGTLEGNPGLNGQSTVEEKSQDGK
jgi:ABC-type Zn uptake system ZnuABC Zn-binding protein ZnuA